MSYSNKLSTVSKEIYDAIQTKIDSLEDGQSIVFFGEETEVVNTSDVETLISEIDFESEEVEDIYADLPYCIIDLRHDGLTEHKVMGLSKVVGEYSIHAHSHETEDEYIYVSSYNVNTPLHSLSEIADLIQ